MSRHTRDRNVSDNSRLDTPGSEEEPPRERPGKESSFDWMPLVMIGLAGTALYGGFDRSLKKCQKRYEEEDRQEEEKRREEEERRREDEERRRQGQDRDRHREERWRGPARHDDDFDTNNHDDSGREPRRGVRSEEQGYDRDNDRGYGRGSQKDDGRDRGWSRSSRSTMDYGRDAPPRKNPRVHPSDSRRDYSGWRERKYREHPEPQLVQDRYSHDRDSGYEEDWPSRRQSQREARPRSYVDVGQGYDYRDGYDSARNDLRGDRIYVYEEELRGRGHRQRLRRRDSSW